MMKSIFRVVRWPIAVISRTFLAILKWVFRKLGLTRVFGIGVGGGIGAFFGSSMGVAFGGGAVVGSLVFAPLLAFIGLLVAWVGVLSLRRSSKQNVDDKADL